MYGDNLPFMILWPMSSHDTVLLTHKMFIFNNMTNLLKYGNNGDDALSMNTFMSEMWGVCLVVSAHVNSLAPGICTAFCPHTLRLIDTPHMHMYMSNFIKNRHGTVSDLTLKLSCLVTFLWFCC